MTRHSPAPWVMGIDGYLYDAEGVAIAFFGRGNYETDGRLAAAAPDLFEALQKIVKDELNRRAALRTDSPAAKFSDARIAAAISALDKAVKEGGQ